MLFKNIVSFSLLALQAGLGGAKPLSGHERRVAAIAERDAPLVARDDKYTDSGTITGTSSDTLRTDGLATCAGLAAAGTAGPGGIDKVLAHVRCIPPDGSSFQDQANDWATQVQNAGMTDVRVVVDIVDVSLVPGPAQGVQTDINNAAKGAAQSLGVSYATHQRESMADPAPSGELKINLDGSITVGGTKVL